MIPAGAGWVKPTLVREVKLGYVASMQGGSNKGPWGHMSGAEAVVAGLRKAGVTRVFGIPAI